jgi:hypothetical protein
MHGSKKRNQNLDKTKVQFNWFMLLDSYRQRPAKCPKPYLRNHRRTERASAFTYPLLRWCRRCGKTATAYPLRRPTESPPKMPSLHGGGERERDRNGDARRGLLCRRLGHFWERERGGGGLRVGRGEVRAPPPPILRARRQRESGEPARFFFHFFFKILSPRS